MEIVDDLQRQDIFSKGFGSGFRSKAGGKQKTDAQKAINSWYVDLYKKKHIGIGAHKITQIWTYEASHIMNTYIDAPNATSFSDGCFSSNILATLKTYLQKENKKKYIIKLYI